MTAPERPDGPLSPWQPQPTPAFAQPAAWDDAYEPAAAPEPARKFSARVVVRAIRRNWWQILLIWTVTSGALVTLAYLRIKPTYEAVALVQIEPPKGRNPIADLSSNNNASAVDSQLETEAQLMATPDILGIARKDEKVAALPRVQSALDADAFLRKELLIQIIPKTRLVRVSMSSQSSEEAVAIVNAVIHAYKASNDDTSAGETRKQTKRLEDFHVEKGREVDEKSTTLRELVNRIDGRAGFLAEPARDDRGVAALARERESITFEEFKGVAEKLNALELDLLEAEKRFDRLKAERKRSAESVKLDRDVAREVQSHPEVARIVEDYDKARQQLERALELVPRTDPSAIKAQQRLSGLKVKYRAAKERLEPRIKERLEREAAGIGEGAVREAEDLVARLQTRRDAYQKKMKDVKVDIQRDKQIQQKDSLEIGLARADYEYCRALRDNVKKQLEAMQYDLEGQSKQVTVREAKVSRMASGDNRTKMMAAAPVGTLAVVLVLFVLLEMGAGRVADPDDLPGRLNLGVIGVVPPLPTAEPARGALTWGNGPEKARRRVEEFVQSLDHLRVQLWATRRPGAGHRCVLITSACVSEGKTTLAAQLAGRCANAGMSTLLIDADLRRPALARLLEVPGEPGLADVLAGEVEPEGAMAVIGNAGGFHLMPAGRIGGDPSRLLEGSRLGELLARLRETFDIIIIDAPPVLPVPDALVLGRHTDGAVLAVRHDSSRYPMVERAQRKLASVGVPILGAVINGVRGTGAHYGNYAYSSAAAATAAPGSDEPELPPWPDQA